MNQNKTFHSSNWTMELVSGHIGNSTRQEKDLEYRDIHHLVYYYSYNIIIPTILCIGIIGNILNLYIFSRGKLRRRLDEIEKSATTGLISLALSDFMFCVVGFPYPFLYGQNIAIANTTSQLIMLVYQTYRIPLLNTMIFTSTWLIILVGMERCLGVARPFHARYLIRVHRTIIADAVVYVIALLFNLPQFFVHTIKKGQCSAECECYYVNPGRLYYNETFHEVYRIVWAILGTFLPLVLLIICNGRLIYELRESKRRFNMNEGNCQTNKITAILVAIICLFIFLVLPSQLLSFFDKFAVTSGNKSYYTYQIALVVTNLLQAINFSVNFILYCTLSKPFRETMRGNMCKLKLSSRSSSETNNAQHRYQLVEVHI